MKTLDFSFQLEQIKISTEEILADLNYPMPEGGRQNGRKPDPAHRKPRA